MYEISSEGSDGKEHFFRKPWFMTTLMFVGMSFCLPLAWLEEHAKTRAAANASNDGSEPLLGNGTNGHEVCTLHSSVARISQPCRASCAVGCAAADRTWYRENEPCGLLPEYMA